MDSESRPMYQPGICNGWYHKVDLVNNEEDGIFDITLFKNLLNFFDPAVVNHPP